MAAEESSVNRRSARDIAIKARCSTEQHHGAITACCMHCAGMQAARLKRQGAMQLGTIDKAATTATNDTTACAYTQEAQQEPAP